MAGSEIRTRDLKVTSPTLQPLTTLSTNWGVDVGHYKGKGIARCIMTPVVKCVKGASIPAFASQPN